MLVFYKTTYKKIKKEALTIIRLVITTKLYTLPNSSPENFSWKTSSQEKKLINKK